MREADRPRMFNVCPWHRAVIKISIFFVEGPRLAFLKEKESGALHPCLIGHKANALILDLVLTIELIFFYILVLQEYWVLTESRIPLKPVLGGTRNVALPISSHKQTQ